ncbi:putative RNA recognition motif domain, nucleotide-binding alpha-beta plait domain superfamily [Helianthus anomalus]
MDVSKKRKTDTGGQFTGDDGTSPPPSQTLTTQDARKILESFTKDQLLNILQTVVVRDTVALSAVRSVADADPTHRKLFIRGIGWETTTDKLRSVFSTFGELEEAIVITDKTTGKSKGYGFVTFKHVDGAVLALKQPSKKIDGRITVAQLAAVRDLSNVDVSMRKVYVGNVPFEISSERLLSYFSAYGEIEEGPLGFDKQSGKVKGFAFFVYRTEEGARKAVADSIKYIDGHQVMSKMATDGKKGKAGDAAAVSGSMPGSMNSGYGGMSSYGGFSGGPPLPANSNPYTNSSVPSGIGSGPGYGNQPLPSFGGGGGYAGGGGYSSGGYGSGGYGSGGYGSGGGAAAPENHGLNSFASSMTRVAPSQGGFADGGKYGPPSAYSAQSNLPPAGPRGPHGGMYQGGHPYY